MNRASEPQSIVGGPCLRRRNTLEILQRAGGASKCFASAHLLYLNEQKNCLCFDNWRFVLLVAYRLFYVQMFSHKKSDVHLKYEELNWL